VTSTPLAALAATSLLGGVVLLVGDRVPAAPDLRLDHDTFAASLTLALAASRLATLGLWISLRSVDLLSPQRGDDGTASPAGSS
jgi:hypothetical protein